MPHVALRRALSYDTLTPKGDEFRMNFEGLGTFFDKFIVFRSISASSE